jgi:tRNA(Ile)-lysidine synthase
MPGKEGYKKLFALEMRVRKTIQKHRMLEPGDRVLVAVSGGADSVALLLCLQSLSKQWNLDLTIAHLNHSIRGKEGDADEKFVRDLGADLRIPVLSETIEVKKRAIAAKKNLEETARQSRYDFLFRAAQVLGAGKIAVGHNLNDQGETVLFRLLRGSGIEGLSAIHPVIHGLVIRPLLECSRASILKYLKMKRAPYRQDSTNSDLHHARNRIRLELAPYLESHFNPKLNEALAREAFQARETWSYIEQESQKAFKRIGCKSGGEVIIDLRRLRKLHPALQNLVLREALRELLGSLRGITSRHIEGIRTICDKDHSGGQASIPHGGSAIRQFDRLCLRKREMQPQPSFARKLKVPGRCRIPEAGITIRAAICPAPSLKALREKCATQAFLDASRLPRTLVIRSKAPGDRYGGPGHRKVKKMLIDGKVPLLQRSTLPMIVAGAAVIWIPGFRPARSWEARPGTKECIRLEILPCRDKPE